jgi:hypothetical protein
MSEPARVAAYVPDLMDRSKVSAATGDEATFVKAPGDLTEVAADVFVVDLDRPGSLDVLPALRGRVVAFGSHFDRATLAAARSCGENVEVRTRSAFFGAIQELLE